MDAEDCHALVVLHLSSDNRDEWKTGLALIKQHNLDATRHFQNLVRIINTDKDIIIFPEIASIICMTGDKGVEELMVLYCRSDVPVKTLCLQLIAWFDELPDSIAFHLTDVIENSEPLIRYSAASVLIRLANINWVSDYLTQLLVCEDKRLRIIAAQGLVQMPTEHRAAKETLLFHLKDHEWEIRRSAAHALQNCMQMDVDVLENVGLLLSDSNHRVSIAAATALLNFNFMPKECVGTLVRFARHRNFGVRSDAVMGLKKLSPSSDLFHQMCIDCLSSHYPDVARSIFLLRHDLGLEPI